MPPVEGPVTLNNGEKSIIFDQSKNELFKLSDNYKSLHRKLKITYKVDVNKEEITPEVLEDAAIFVIPSPKEKFTESEFNTLKGYLDGGGAVLVTLGEGGEKNFETNINYLLEEYGLMINNVEKGFSSVVQHLTKQRNKLDVCTKGDLRLHLTNIQPDIQALTAVHQAQGSH